MSDAERQNQDVAALRAFLAAAGLCRETAVCMIEPLTGGVSSDIVLVHCEERVFVVKRALARLKVAREWTAPVSRNASEVGYMREAARIVPGAVPEILADDPDFGGYAMEFLAPDHHPVWKAELRDGRVDLAFAARLGTIMSRIHAGTHGRADIAATFDTGELFHALRLEPYLEATADGHPELRAALFALSAQTAAIKSALVHGDISPKNILCGPDGPVILDAECAWHGDPAFDLAFCLNHLLLKCLWNPSAAQAFLACFDRLAASYLDGVTWEEPDALEVRAARLLPALLLARVDGKSPAEYLDEAGKGVIRRFAPPLILKPVARLASIRQAWAKENCLD
ncbi:aminoglycoside phosphotransferase family protein [Rhizobium sp. KVB221]|uniref:Aminoglycoside phosphotransferase family protein n=1 Tax=Rhizobium setariae TaxID=2801340 RepID=A0A937CNT0_9HYPH|nr:aminoglycoside phosphotransferase family protein [Rhizobium setariae]MBL0371558.1 aminoglycoside phosphotransferase family protein [Rhizobium setariae]